MMPATATIEGNDFGMVWFKSVRAIMNSGRNRMSTSDNTGAMTKDLYLTTITYGNAIKQIREFDIHPDYPMKAGSLETYCDEFTYDFVEEQKRKDDIGQFDYTYMERFTSGNVDQLRHMHDLLRSDGIIRRNQMITWDVEKDCDSAVPPCIQHLQIKVVEDGLVDVYLIARSRDIFGAYPANQCGIVKMLDKYVLCGDYDIGMIADTSNCAHIYAHNWDEANSIKMQQSFRGVQPVAYRGR